MEYGIELKRRGRTYFGLCPFHQEKTASFAVSQEAGLFHCFGCGVGGDVIGFIVRFQRVTFPEALRRLAARAGLEVEGLARGVVEEARHPERTRHEHVSEGSPDPLDAARPQADGRRIAAARFGYFANNGRRP